MSDILYAVMQGGMRVATVVAGEADNPRAWAETIHYLTVYRQDGPAKMWRRSSNRHWRMVDDGSSRRAVSIPEPSA